MVSHEEKSKRRITPSMSLDKFVPKKKVKRLKRHLSSFLESLFISFPTSFCRSRVNFSQTSSVKCSSYCVDLGCQVFLPVFNSYPLCLIVYKAKDPRHKQFGPVYVQFSDKFVKLFIKTWGGEHGLHVHT